MIMKLAYAPIYELIRVGEYDLVVDRIVDINSGRLKKPFLQDANHAWYCVGDACFKAGRFLEAVVAFRRALKADPEDVMCFIALGNSYDAMGRPKLAERMLRRALVMRLDQNDRASILLNLGNALYDQNRYKDAIEEYEIIMDRKDQIGERARKNIALAKLKCKAILRRESKR